MIQIPKGSTSQPLNIYCWDPTTNGGKTGLAYNTSALVASYCRPGAARTAITLVTQTTTGAYSSGGFVEIDATNLPGWYRLDIPNAALATGVEEVTIGMTLSGNAICQENIDLVDPVISSGWATPTDVSNLQTHGDSNWATATGFATPTDVTNATSNLDVAVSTRLADADYVAPDNATIALIDAKTTNLPSDPADQSEVEAAISASESTILAAIALVGPGTGIVEVPIIVESGGSPLDGCQVIMKSGGTIVAGGYTNASGLVTFYLDAGTYQMYRNLSGYTFPQGIDVVVS